MFNAEEWSALSTLILADNDSFRSVVRSNCRRIGFGAVEDATTGTEAINMLMVKFYSVLIVQREMKNGGVKFIDLLRQNASRIAGGDRLPVVVIANAGATPEMIFEAADAGANYLIQLPVSAKGLMKGLHIAITQPGVFASRAQAVRQIVA